MAVTLATEERQLREHVERNSPAAIFELGRRMLERYDEAAPGSLRENPTWREGMDHVERAVRLGCVDAMLSLANWLDEERFGLRGDDSRGLALCRRASDLGSVAGHYSLASRLLFEPGERQEAIDALHAEGAGAEGAGAAVTISKKDASMTSQRRLRTALAEHGVDTLTNRGHVLGAVRRHQDGVDVGVAREPALHRRERHPDQVVQVHAHRVLALGRQDSGHGAGHVAEAQVVRVPPAAAPRSAAAAAAMHVPQYLAAAAV